MIMSADGGSVFDELRRLVRFSLGGAAGNGKQYVSWIHGDDFAQAVDFLIAHEEFEGPVNICSPEALPNAEFMSALRDALGTRIGLPASKFMLRVGAVFLQTEAELILKSRRVLPGRLLRGGFTFRFPQWLDAARDLVRKWKMQSERRGQSRWVSAEQNPRGAR
jgi:hypothetical protein